MRDFAIQAGLTDSEADEVVQETAIAMARHLPEYRYDPKVCRFKTWLLNQASWRVKDRLKKRRREAQAFGLSQSELLTFRSDRFVTITSTVKSFAGCDRLLQHVPSFAT